jgi:hypothetical protein
MHVFRAKAQENRGGVYSVNSRYGAKKTNNKYLYNKECFI